MGPLDAAHDALKRLLPEISTYINSVETEADTRLKIIDRILAEVLSWPLASIHAEKHAEGGYADYACTVDGRFRLVLEAKQDGRSLGVEGREAGNTYRLNGAVFRGASADEGIGQCIRYCGSKNAELACVTNGREWIIFRGNRIGDGLDTRQGMGFVFPNLVAVEENFALFYSLMSYEAAKVFGYRPYFQEAEGQPIRTAVFNRPNRTPTSAHFLNAGTLSADLDRIMSSFFQRLTGDTDPELLKFCFVETRESDFADERLARIAEDISDRIVSLESGRGSALQELISRAQTMQRNEFVLIVGTKGAGKSTFITRFFDNVLPAKIARHCVVTRVDLRDSPGDASQLDPNG